MKSKTAFVILYFLLCVKIPGQGNTNRLLRLYPLNKGDIWIYSETNFDRWSGDIKSLIWQRVILGDTLMNNNRVYKICAKKYKDCIEQYITYERLDSISLKLYLYDANKPASGYEKLYKDFSLNLGDTLITSELIFRYYSEDSISFNRQRMPRHNYFSSTGGSHTYTDVLEGFLDDIGIYSQDLETHDYRETSFLIACSVNGRKYGDTTISKVSEKKESAGKMSLYQNYPNPFNPSTTISYYIPKEGFVRLKLYDNLGREINTLVEAFKPAGEHSFIFYAGSLPCGVYFYRIESQGLVDSKKLILIK